MKANIHLKENDEKKTFYVQQGRKQRRRKNINMCTIQNSINDIML